MAEGRAARGRQCASRRIGSAARSWRAGRRRRWPGSRRRVAWSRQPLRDLARWSPPVVRGRRRRRGRGRRRRDACPRPLRPDSASVGHVQRRATDRRSGERRTRAAASGGQCRSGSTVRRGERRTDKPLTSHDPFTLAQRPITLTKVPIVLWIRSQDASSRAPPMDVSGAADGRLGRRRWTRRLGRGILNTGSHARPDMVGLMK